MMSLHAARKRAADAAWEVGNYPPIVRKVRLRSATMSSSADDFAAMFADFVRSRVPCGTCRRCCQGNSMVMLMPQDGDDVASYEHEFVELPVIGSGPILKRKPNGDCVYLGENGCTIHDRAPIVCRVFDCRGAYADFMRRPRAERRRALRDRLVDHEILDVGRRLSREAA